MEGTSEGFRNGRITDFFFDGQDMPVDEYRKFYPEDGAYIRTLVTEEKLVIGLSYPQPDYSIYNGESVINNLRSGIQSAGNLGYVSRVTYLPDSFGHSWDFPKIFHQLETKDFVITCGVRDSYKLDSKFYTKSSDGSELLVCIVIASYGYGRYAFCNGALFDESALDHNEISAQSLIDRPLSYFTLSYEFTFPLDSDQNLTMLGVPE